KSGQSGGVFTDGLAKEGTQGKRARPSLNEAGAVSGVLDGVGEHEGLLLSVIQTVETKEVGQSNGEQRGHRGTQVSDGVGLTAGGAGLRLGQLVSVLTREGKHRNDET